TIHCPVFLRFSIQSGYRDASILQLYLHTTREGTSQWFSVNIRILRQFPDFLGESSLDFFIIPLQSVFCGSPDDDSEKTHNQYTP
ncbi:MAG TPA: hypothetical protein PLE70_05905, partial [Methanolinea sp.]|nr:hypothetical protein [Methanolinea sp.]